jgi:hypothetical protein
LAAGAEQANAAARQKWTDGAIDSKRRVSEAREACGDHSQGDGDRTSRTMTEFGNHAVSA